MALLKRASNFYHTVKPLRWEQIVYRLKYRLLPLKALQPIPFMKGRTWCWHGPEVLLPSMVGPSKVCFLNLPSEISNHDCWNNSQFEKLWLYNLHYFDDLNAQENEKRTAWQYDLIKRWINENPPVNGNGWEPYPLSLRLVNCVKWYNRTVQTDNEILTSIAVQAQALSKQLEYHILGNHLFANAKALAFVGAFLQGKEAEGWLDLALRILGREIPEQFLADGGHFELSPMYHCILLWDLLELIQLANLANIPALSDAAVSWREVATAALNWLTAMIHPDGEVSFFNDSAIGIAAKPSDIFAFATSLGINWQNNIDRPLFTLQDSGYSRLKQGEHTVLFDHAAVGPDYLPGHAHADTLSLEWSVGTQRVLVNSGTSIYGVSGERLRQRQTAAHNTVVVDSEDSSEVWSGFRVARRAYAKLLSSAASINETSQISASHNGYKRLAGKVEHKRSVCLSSCELIITDELFGDWHQAEAMFHMHPDVAVVQDADTVIITLPSGVRYAVISESLLRVETSTWHPHFGVSIENFKLVVPIKNSTLSVAFRLIQE